MKKHYQNLSTNKGADYYYKSIIFFWLSVFGAILLILFLFPQLDILFSQNFYSPTQGFYYKNHYLAIWSFKYTLLITRYAAIIYLCIWIYQYFLCKKINKIIIYLIVTLAIGPGLIVNTLLKNNFGRARPSGILQFGGYSTFSQPFVISNQCDLNCSFTSGHAAAGYYTCVISFILSRKRFAWFFHLGLVIGCLVGFGRIVQGAHFLSDVVGSACIVILVNYLCSELIFGSNQKVSKSYTDLKINSPGRSTIERS